MRKFDVLYTSGIEQRRLIRSDPDMFLLEKRRVPRAIKENSH